MYNEGKVQRFIFSGKIAKDMLYTMVSELLVLCDKQKSKRDTESSAIHPEFIVIVYKYSLEIGIPFRYYFID